MTDHPRAPRMNTEPNGVTAMTSAADPLRAEILRADHCHGLVTRDGEEDACGKPPVAIIDATAAEAGCYWPACAYHANRYGRGHVVPLARIVEALR